MIQVNYIVNTNVDQNFKEFYANASQEDQVKMKKGYQEKLMK